MKFRQYLKTLLKTFELQKNSKKRFVIGNSSADYDSIFGSLIYGYFLSLTLNKTFIPLIDCSKQDVPLRLQVNYIMKKLDIHHEDLIYSQQVFFDQQLDEFYLYDHNNRANANIKQIIDHHAFKLQQNSPDQNNRIICTVGSALTLLFYLYNPSKIPVTSLQIINLYENYWKVNPKLQVEYDPIIEQIMRYGILMDSFNFDPNQKERWTQADKGAIRIIEQSHIFDIQYQQLSDLKFNEKVNLQLNLEQHLRKDYKQLKYEKLPIIEYSIIYLNPDVFLQKYGKQLVQLFQKKGYSCYMLMFIWIGQNKKTQREAMFTVSQKNIGSQYLSTVKKIQSVLNNLNMQKKQEYFNFQRWKDPSSTISRKKLDKQFTKL